METINDNDFNRIEDFISGKLSSEQEQKFRERLNTEPELEKAYRFRLKIAPFWNEAETYKETKKQVKILLNHEKGRRKRFTMVYYIAASVVILIGIAIFYMNRDKQTSQESLYVVSGNDTSQSKPVMLETNEQPQKGSLYSIPPEYTIHDTLIVHRPKDMQDAGKLHIECVPEHAIVREYPFTAGMDSILIPLTEFRPGDYTWKLAGTSLSGNFIIRDDTDKGR